MSNIKELAPFLACHFVDTDIEIDNSTLQIHQTLVGEFHRRFGDFSKYLEVLHDSWVIKTDITENRLSLTLNDFTTHVFADAMIAHKKIQVEEDKLIFPLKIDFEISSLTFNTVDEEGDIKEIETTIFHQYLYEQIIRIDNNIVEIGLVVWINGTKTKRGQEILLLLSTKEILLSELQEKAWISIFGHTYDNYYRYFQLQLSKGRYLSDQSICTELLNEYEQSITE